MTEFRKFQIDVARIGEQMLSLDDEDLKRHIKTEIMNLSSYIGIGDELEESLFEQADTNEVLFHLQRLNQALKVYIEDFEGKYSNYPLLLRNTELLKEYEESMASECYDFTVD